MVVRVYLSRTSGNFEIKRQQEFILQVLDSRKIEYEEIDISDPGCEEQKRFMREKSPPKEGQKVALPPQVFKDEEYCGDYSAFHLANEDDEIYTFLKLPEPTKDE